MWKSILHCCLSVQLHSVWFDGSKAYGFYFQNVEMYWHIKTYQVPFVINMSISVTVKRDRIGLRIVLVKLKFR